MNEFNHPATEKDDQPDTSAIVQHEKPGLKYFLLEKQYILGLNGPWLIGMLTAATLGVWYLFGTVAPSSSDELNAAAGFEDVPPAASQPQNRSLSPPMSQPASDNVKQEVATMVNGVKTYAETNRTAIQRLAGTVKTLQQQADAAQQLQSQYLNEISVLKSRVATLEVEKVNTATSAHHRPRLLTSGMKVNSVQDGAARIFWKNKTWAVREGDTLADGKVSIIRIDSANRQVFTTEGVIR
ncbi:conjugal transfer protein TraP [Enterobacter hormaechei]